MFKSLMNKLNNTKDVLKKHIKRIVDEHARNVTLHELEIYPAHIARDEVSDNTFRNSVKKMREDGNDYCIVCGTKEKIEYHHCFCEDSFANIADFQKLKEVAEKFDFYGYAEKMKDIPITEVSDIRNLWGLCEMHHVGVNSIKNSTNGVGIHALSAPMFFIQMVCKKLCNPVPQKGETVSDVMKRIEDNNK